jgi:hypothetical protein
MINSLQHVISWQYRSFEIAIKPQYKHRRRPAWFDFFFDLSPLINYPYLY